MGAEKTDEYELMDSEKTREYIDFACSEGLEGMKVLNNKPLNTVYRRSSLRWCKKIALSCSR